MPRTSSLIQQPTHALNGASLANHLDDHDLGLQHDLATLCAQQASRRRALRWLGAGASLAASLAVPGAARAAGTCTLIPAETAGPYPGDGSNSAAGGIANALALSGIVRSDIRSSVGGAVGTAPGLPLTMRLQLVSAANSCAPLEGYAIYLWHCTRDGLYSMYSSGVTSQNYLRGVQLTDADGAVSFQTIFPGCYSGRMPHMHVEVYRNVASATSYANKLRTTQIAFPVATCQSVYRKALGYTASINNFANISFATDMVFSDGYETQMSTIVLDARVEGYTAALQIAI